MQARDTCIQLILAKNKNHKTYLQAVIKGGAQDLMASLVAQMVKKLPATQKTRVRSLGWEDPLEKEMATPSSILDGEFHGQKSLVDYSLWGHKESDKTK